MSRFSVKYKVREGDTYENLLQRFGSTLANAGIYGDEDLVNNKEFNLGVNTREEAELLQKRDLEYQRKIQRDKDLAYINKNRDWLEEQNFFQGGEKLTDDQMIERYRKIYKSGKKEEKDREVSRKELNKKLESGKIDAKYNKMARQAGVINERTAKFSPQIRYHNDRKEHLEKNGSSGIIGRGLTLNNNKGTSFEHSMQNRQDQEELGQDLKDALYNIGVGTLAGNMQFTKLPGFGNAVKTGAVGTGSNAVQATKNVIQGAKDAYKLATTNPSKFAGKALKAGWQTVKDTGINMVSHPIENATNMFIVTPKMQEWTGNDTAGFLLGTTLNGALFGKARSALFNKAVGNYNKQLATATTEEALKKTQQGAVKKMLDFANTNVGNRLIGTNYLEGSVGKNLAAQAKNATIGMFTPTIQVSDNGTINDAFNTLLSTATGKAAGRQVSNYAERNTDGARDGSQAFSGAARNLASQFNRGLRTMGLSHNETSAASGSNYTGYGTGTSATTQSPVDPDKHKWRGIVHKNQYNTFGNDGNFHSYGTTIEGTNTVLPKDASPQQAARAVLNFAGGSNAANDLKGSRATWGINTANQDYDIDFNTKAYTHDKEGNLVEIPMFKQVGDSYIVNPEVGKATRGGRHQLIFNNDGTFNNIGGYNQIVYGGKQGDLKTIVNDNWAYHRIGGTYGTGGVTGMLGAMVDDGGKNVHTMYAMPFDKEMLRHGTTIQSAPSAIVKNQTPVISGILKKRAYRNFKNFDYQKTNTKAKNDFNERKSMYQALGGDKESFGNYSAIPLKGYAEQNVVGNINDYTQQGKDGKYYYTGHLMDKIISQGLEKTSKKETDPHIITYKPAKKEKQPKTIDFNKARKNKKE